MFLLDTHVLVWPVHTPGRLSPTARRAIEEKNYFISCASLWEMISKKGKPTSMVADPLEWWEERFVSTSIVIVSSPFHSIFNWLPFA